MKEYTKKQLILNEGYALMREKGYRAASIDEVVQRLSIPKGTFYYYFSSKEEFTIEILKHYAATVYGHMDELLRDRGVKPITRIIGLYSQYIDEYVNSQTLGYGNFATKITEEVGDEYPGIRKAANEIFDHIKLAHTRCLSDAKTTGQLRGDFEPDTMAEFIINAWEGSLRRMKATGNVKPLLIFREMLGNYLLK